MLERLWYIKEYLFVWVHFALFYGPIWHPLMKLIQNYLKKVNWFLLLVFTYLGKWVLVAETKRQFWIREAAREFTRVIMTNQLLNFVAICTLLIYFIYYSISVQWIYPWRKTRNHSECFGFRMSQCSICQWFVLYKKILFQLHWRRRNLCQSSSAVSVSCVSF